MFASEIFQNLAFIPLLRSCPASAGFGYGESCQCICWRMSALELSNLVTDTSSLYYRPPELKGVGLLVKNNGRDGGHDGEPEVTSSGDVSLFTLPHSHYCIVCVSQDDTGGLGDSSRTGSSPPLSPKRCARLIVPQLRRQAKAKTMIVFFFPSTA